MYTCNLYKILALNNWASNVISTHWQLIKLAVHTWPNKFQSPRPAAHILHALKFHISTAETLFEALL